MAQVTDIDVVNQALALIGEVPVTSLDDASQTAVIVSAAWGDFVADVLGRRAWRFATKVAQLSRDHDFDNTKSVYRYRFLLPPDRVTGAPFNLITTAVIGGYPVPGWVSSGGHAFANVDPVFCEYRFRPETAEWPAAFRRLVAHGFAAEMALPLTEQRELADRLRATAWGTPGMMGAGGLYRHAAQQDAGQGLPQPMMDDGGPFIAARWGGR